MGSELRTGIRRGSGCQAGTEGRGPGLGARILSPGSSLLWGRGLVPVSCGDGRAWFRPVIEPEPGVRVPGLEVCD